MAFERKNLNLLRIQQTVQLYKDWKDGNLKLNNVGNTNILLEVGMTHNKKDYFYAYPIDLNYLFSPKWRESNLKSPFGFFRWAVEMDTALRSGMVKGYEKSRLPRSITHTVFPLIKKLKDENCGFKYMSLSLSKLLLLNTFLAHCYNTSSLGPFTGNNNQAVLAQVIGISRLANLFSALSNLTDINGKPWKKKLEYNYLNLPAAQANESATMLGNGPFSVRGRRNLWELSEKEQFRNEVEGLLGDPAATTTIKFRFPANRWLADGSARPSIF